MVKLKCQYCGAIYGEKDMKGAETYGLEYSHGTCPDCYKRQLEELGEPT